MAAALRAARRRRWTTLAGARPAADADAAAAAMATLDQATTTHLDHEERETEQLSWASTTTRRSRQMGKQFSAARLAPDGGRVLRVDGRRRDSPRSRPRLRESVPGPVLAIIGGIFGRKLPQGGRARLGVVRLLLTPVETPDRVGTRHPRRAR